MPYFSERSGRIYSDPVKIDEDLYVDILYSEPYDPVKPSTVIRWYGEFPEGHMVYVTKEEAALVNDLPRPRRVYGDRVIGDGVGIVILSHIKTNKESR
jgi:hypothetical protein